MEELVYPRRLQLGCSAADGGALLALTLVVLRLRRRVR
ncbi:MAG: MYXO-CTERM sorting domain-containing protein [Myxococcota bacterium]